jgi:hypothetical protein
MSAAVGYGDQYSNDAWTPVRISLHNHTSSDIRGTVEIPDNDSGTNYGPPQQYRSVYQTSVVLPAGSTKRVTLYLPMGSINGQVAVRFRGSGVSVQHTYWPQAFDPSIFVIGTLTDDTATTAWVRSLPASSSTATVNLGPTPAAGLDPVPDVLSTFDTIVLTNLDASRLDRDQLSALTTYVRNGGSLILIGGPNGQSIVHSLPGALVPGTPAGTTTVSSLSGLSALGYGSPHRGSDVISVLTHPRGTVLASQNGTPLVVRMPLGQGNVVYLAFDPQDSPVAGWQGRPGLMNRIVGMANPYGLDRGALSSNGGSPINPLMMKFGGSAIAAELANIPQAALPSIVLFLALAVLYILLIGPLNFLVLRRLRRREMMWVTLPLLGVLCVATTFGVAFRLKGNAVFVNGVSVIQLDGGDPARPVSAYMSLFAPVRGDYHLSYAGTGLTTTVPTSWYNNPSGSRPIGYRFQEGGDPAVTLPSMSMWTMRNVEVDSSVSIPGSVQSDLTVDGKGYIVGTVHNGTALPLLHPTLFAGQGFERLADIPAGGTAGVHVKPSGDIHARYPSSPWYRAFRGSVFGGWYGGYYGGGPGPIAISQGPGTIVSSNGVTTFYRGPCCYGSQPVTRQEKTLADRIRNAAAVIPDAQALLSSSEVTLVAWNTASLGDVRVDGNTPNRRDINLLVAPLSVHMRPGSFTLRPGTLGAEVVEANPAPPTQGCCPLAGSPHALIFGTGGAATFAWSLPAGSRYLHFTSLDLGVNAGGAAGAHLGTVFDWTTHRWVPVNLRYGTTHLTRPNRFISPDGRILLRLRANDSSGDVRIADPLQALEISGKGVAA